MKTLKISDVVSALRSAKPSGQNPLTPTGSVELLRATEAWTRTVCKIAHTAFGYNDKDAETFKQCVFEK